MESAKDPRTTARICPVKKGDRLRLVPFAEILAIVGLFWIYAGWPIPDVNEQYYLGKPIHFWNPDWLRTDTFLNTPDSHWFYYCTFGFFSLFMGKTAFALFGRCLIWFLTAWSWRSLSRTFFPVRWLSIGTAFVFLFFLDRFHLAGEWIVGGVEGKGFAFPFVFWGLSAFCRGQYARTWLLLGLASAFHVLVGGWTVIACLLSWLIIELGNALKSTEPIRTIGNHFFHMFPFLLLGGLFSLPGLIPALLLDQGASLEIQREAHRIYVFGRLSHHLVPSLLPWTFQIRFLLLVILWLLIGGLNRFGKQSSTTLFRLNVFTGAALVFAIVGILIDYGSILLAHWGLLSERELAAELLRFYWFRLSDWAVPLGLTFGSFFLFYHCKDSLSSENFSPEKNERVRSIANSLVFWGGLSLLIFIPIKMSLVYLSASQAKALTVDPNFPVTMRPVDAVAFLGTVCLLALTLLAICFVKKKRSVTLSRTTMIGMLFLSGVLSIAAPFYFFISSIDLRTSPVICRSDPQKESIAEAWHQLCRWVHDPENTDPDERFLVPRGYNSFKWYADRAEVIAWKEIPQDALSIKEWSEQIETLYANPGMSGEARWNQPLIVVLINKGRKRVLQECTQLGIDYIIVETPPYTISAWPEAVKRYQEFLDHDLVWQNAQFTIFHFPSHRPAASLIPPGGKTP